MKDKKFPILFIILSIVVTFSVFLLSSMHATITGAAIRTEFSGFSGWTLIWVALVIVTIFLGISILHKK